MKHSGVCRYIYFMCASSLDSERNRIYMYVYFIYNSIAKEHYYDKIIDHKICQSMNHRSWSLFQFSVKKCLSLKHKKIIKQWLPCKTSAPIGAWECTFRTFLKIMTDPPTDQTTNQQKDMRVHRKVAFLIRMWRT